MGETFGLGRKINYCLAIFHLQKQPPEMFCVKRCSYRNLTKLTGKHLCRSLFLNKVAGHRLATLLKKRLWHRCFFCEFCQISKNIFFTEQLWTTASTLLIFHEHASIGLCIKPGIQAQGTKCGEPGEWGECYIPGNVAKYSGEFSPTFRGMSPKIPGNVIKHSGEYLQTFPEMLPNIPGNFLKHSGECC